MIGRAPLRRTRMRRVGKKGRARAVRIKTLLPHLEARSGRRCELPWCRRRGRWLDAHHIVKRSQSGEDSTDNVVYLCRVDHSRLDLPADSPRHLRVERFQDDLGHWFALFVDGPLVQAVPLAVPESIAPSGASISTSVDK